MTLSPYTAGHVFVEYADGSTNYLLPTSWHDAIRTMNVGARQPQVANVGVVSNVVKQVGMEVGKEAGKEIGKEVGKELIGALFQSGGCIHYITNVVCLPSFMRLGYAWQPPSTTTATTITTTSGFFNSFNCHFFCV